MVNRYRFRLYPNAEQQQILLRWIGCQRLIYNAKVQKDGYFRRFAQRLVGTAGELIPVDQPYSRFITLPTKRSFSNRSPRRFCATVPSNSGKRISGSLKN